MPQIISANRAVRGLQGVVKSTTLYETRINTERVVECSIVEGEVTKLWCLVLVVVELSVVFVGPFLRSFLIFFTSLPCCILW